MERNYLYSAKEEFLSIEDTYWAAQDDLSSVIAATKTTSTQDTSDRDQLLHIAILPFLGKYADWPGFGDVFQILIRGNE